MVSGTGRARHDEARARPTSRASGAHGGQGQKMRSFLRPLLISGIAAPGVRGVAENFFNAPAKSDPVAKPKKKRGNRSHFVWLGDWVPYERKAR